MLSEKLITNTAWSHLNELSRRSNTYKQKVECWVAEAGGEEMES